VDVDGLMRLAASISRFAGDAPVAAAPQERVQPSLLDSKEFGHGLCASVAAAGAWHPDKALTKRIEDRKYEAPMERVLFAMVANRAMAPSSKLAMEDWVKGEVALPGIEQFEVHQGYREMDFLMECVEEIQREVFLSR